MAAIPKHREWTPQYLAPRSPPKFQPEAFSEDQEWIQTQLINQPEQKKRKLIRPVRRKARQLINDQQTEDLLINLIDASQRPYILELNHKLFTNQDLDIDPFTPEERQFWASLEIHLCVQNIEHGYVASHHHPQLKQHR